MTKLERLLSWFDGKSRVLVSLSGGVDSSLVAYAAYTKLGDSAIAITADYQTLATDELESAKHVAAEIGINHTIIQYNELENAQFVKNDQRRCYYCRTELGNHLVKFAAKHTIDTIVDGTNMDDLGDYRPGIAALQANGIQSPLVETMMSKYDIRECAREVGLSVHDKPSNSCLASRIPWGQRVTAARLARIEVGEQMVKQLLGTPQVRVRDMAGHAKIEIEPALIHNLDDNQISILYNRLATIGFHSAEIDQTGYRPGKINVIPD